MKAPARVLHVITQLELGGAQQNTLYSCAHLDRARFAPVLVCGPGGILDDDARALPDVRTVFLSALAIAAMWIPVWMISSCIA